MLIYTAIYGKYDKLFEQPDIGVKYICYTDDPNLKSDCWDIHYIPSTLSSVYAAKYWKLHPPEDESIWIDGSMEITNPNFVNMLTKYVDKIGFYPHNRRTSIKQEIKTLKAIGFKSDFDQQYSGYINEGFTDNKLFCGGLIVRLERCEEFNRVWYNEILRWSPRDQLSLTYALWKTQTPVSKIKLKMYSGDPHTIHKHKRRRIKC